MKLTTDRRRICGVVVVACLALLAALGGTTYAATATTKITFTRAYLVGGWTRGSIGSGSAYPGYAKDPRGVVHLRGSLQGGTPGQEAFILSSALAPAHNVLLPDFTGNGTPAGVIIEHTGQVVPVGSLPNTLQTLDGMSFVARSAPKLRFTAAKLQPGWRYGGQGSAQPGYEIDSLGVVHLQGGLAGGNDTPAFVLPPALAPAHTLWLPIYTGHTTEGSLEIATNGQVIPFGSTVAGFASLDGITFPSHGTRLRFSKALLLHAVHPVGFGAAPPSYSVDRLGVVHLRGGLSGPPGEFEAFVLPKALRPTHRTYFPIYTYGGTLGAAIIGGTGAVYLDPGNSNAFASLDGISFAVGQ